MPHAQSVLKIGKAHNTVVPILHNLSTARCSSEVSPLGTRDHPSGSLYGFSSCLHTLFAYLVPPLSSS